MNAKGAGAIPFDDSADVHLRQALHVDHAQHFTLLRIRQSLDRCPHRILLDRIAHRRKRVEVELLRSFANPLGQVVFAVYLARAVSLLPLLRRAIHGAWNAL